VVRVALQAMAAVLGGTQSLHTNSLDETLALPTEETARIALRTQQIIAEETGVVNAVDPLGGSYFVEKLTCELETEAYGYIQKIDDMGGMLKAIDLGYPQGEIANSSYIYQKQLEAKEKIIVGVNDFVVEEEPPIPLLRIDETLREAQVKKLAQVKAARNAEKVKATLASLKKACAGTENVMPRLIDCVRAYCTENEMIATMQGEFGTHTDPAMF
jgi:methylmalonyl-CoA mutase N-terminal domain/subunit